jgi:hypothetical protein
MKRLLTSVPLALALIGLLLLSGCGSGQDAGPLRSITAGGQPLVDGGGSLVTPGESADTTAWVVSSAPAVTLVSASAVPVPGFPVGHLIHVAVASTLDFIAGGHGWPPSVPTRPLPGATIGRGQTDIVFGISGSRVGREYVVAGLKIVYRYDGKLYSTVAWMVGGACVVRDPQRAPGNACDKEQNAAITRTQKLAGSS